MAHIILVLGGARSGKSEFAEQLLTELKLTRKGYIATSRIWDEEVKHRVKIHKERRPATWLTFEYPETDAARIAEILPQADAFLFDCVTMYVNNLIMDTIELSRATEKDVISESSLDDLMHELTDKLQNMFEILEESDATFIFVSNELGLGIIPDNPISRIYRDLVGFANQKIAHLAKDVYFVACGIPISLKRGD